MKAFLTGSRVYGVPHDDSDVDLVVRVDTDVKNILEAHGGIPVRFGRLNLILCDSDEKFEGWRQGTEECKKLAPTTKVRAIDVFKRLLGVLHPGPSGPAIQ